VSSSNADRGARKVYPQIFVDYVMEPGLVNGRNHYTSANGKHVVSFCGSNWSVTSADYRQVIQLEIFTRHSRYMKLECIYKARETWACKLNHKKNYVYISTTTHVCLQTTIKTVFESLVFNVHCSTYYSEILYFQGSMHRLHSFW
jgi:hypothetical protein